MTVSGDTSLRRVIAELDDGATLSGNGDFAAAKVSIDAAQMHLPALSQVPAEIRIRALAGEGKTNLSQRDFASAKTYADAAVAIIERATVSNDMLGQVHWTRANAEWGLHTVAAAEADYREAMNFMTLS